MDNKEKLTKLVQRFEEHLDDLKHKDYKEMQLCTDYINPLFVMLGWDIENERDSAEKFRDVVQQYRLAIGSTSKAPDYLFRIGGTPVFFVEAKKPSVDINSAKDPAFQLRRYGWNKKEVDISILTDFEDFSVYNCQIKPQEGDEPHVGRIARYNYKQYLTHWDEIGSMFSRASVERGSLDKLLKEKSIKGIKETVDESFLKMIEDWRDMLARNLALRNPELDVKQLNYAVQQTIDRIIFLRIAEDRGIEPPNQLEALKNGTGVYGRLIEHFKLADQRYNSGLFHFVQEKAIKTPPDNLSLTLSIDDKVLKDMIVNLYPPKSPYDFSAMPADILGQVYERFLGKVIRLTDGHRAVVDEKPEVRKAGGVYYTPTYIVDYIVQNTVGKLVEGKTPAEVAKLRILDPACGSGSFLIGAYQFLLDWHIEYYKANDPEKHAKGKNPPICQLKLADGTFGWKLTTEKRKEILLNNIYGVDIDRQAVEVTKLNLLLKVLEEGHVASLIEKMQRALPDLGSNIKCGNSLIESDFYAGKHGLFDTEEMYRINTFDWDREFPEIIRWKDKNKRELAEGFGFDAVIGNPPYVRIHNLVDFYPKEVSYIQTNYSTAGFGKVDIYIPFIEKGQSLLNNNGLLGFILPNKFIQSDYGVGIRKLIIAERCLKSLIDFSYSQVFENATIYTCILILSGDRETIFLHATNKNNDPPLLFLQNHNFERLSIDDFSEKAWSLCSNSETLIISKILSKGSSLDVFVETMITGVKTGSNEIYVFKKRINQDQFESLTGEIVPLDAQLIQPYQKGGCLKRYFQTSNELFLLYPYENVNGKTTLIDEVRLKNSFKRTWEYLNRNRKELEGRQKGKLEGLHWYGLSFSSDINMFLSGKIVTPTLAPRNSFSIDTSCYFFPQGAGGGCGIVLKKEISQLFILGLLNSKLLTFYFQKISSCFQGGWYAYEPRYLKRIPVLDIKKLNKKDVERHDAMVRLVEQMLELNKRLQQAKTPDDKELLSRQIEATDRQIDGLVYELYELTPEEIAIVEESTK